MLLWHPSRAQRIRDRSILIAFLSVCQVCILDFFLSSIRLARGNPLDLLVYLPSALCC